MKVTTILLQVENHLPQHTGSYFRRLEFSSVLLWESPMSEQITCVVTAVIIIDQHVVLLQKSCSIHQPTVVCCQTFSHVNMNERKELYTYISESYFLHECKTVDCRDHSTACMCVCPLVQILSNVHRPSQNLVWTLWYWRVPQVIIFNFLQPITITSQRNETVRREHR